MKRQNIAIMITGLALFGFVATKVRWSDIAQQLKAVSMALPVLFALSGLRMALQTAAWSCALRTYGIRASKTNLIGARLASRSMGYLSVLGPVVSEPMRIRLLENRSPEATTASLIDTGVYWASSWFFTIFATVCAIQFISGGRRLQSLVMLVGCP